MANVRTEFVTLSITIEAADMLRAFTRARNGSIDNQADNALRAGIGRLLTEAPKQFQDRYWAFLREAHHD